MEIDFIMNIKKLLGSYTKKKKVHLRTSGTSLNA